MAFPSFRRHSRSALAIIAIAAITACGGGGGSGDATPALAPASASNAPISRLWVAGDSLADVGALGMKATIQRASDRATGYPLYPELVASSLGVGSLCSRFTNDGGVSFSTNAGCTDFAVGGAEIVNPITRGGTALPLSLQYQLEHAVAANGGLWGKGDLVLIDAGANDAASLADAYLDARAGGTGDDATFVAFLGQQLSASTINDALAKSDGGSVAAGLYMQQLARTWWEMVRANTLDKGATRVVLVNVPDLSLLPRFRDRANGLAATEGAAAGTAFLAALRQWVVGFNTELARLAAGDSRVVLVSYFDNLTAQVNSPASFGLTNATDPSCPPTGGFEACTDAALDASPRMAGAAPGWWKTWAFSDGFHPSPRGHEILAEAINQAIARAGWR